MKTAACLATFAALALVACAAQSPVTLESIIAQHTLARGGAQEIENVHSMRVELEIVEPDFAVSGIYVATRNGQARIDIYAEGQRVFTEALNAAGGWQIRQGESIASDLSEDGRQALQRGLIGNLYGLHELRALGYRLSLAGRITLDGNAYWAIDQIAPGGHSKRLYLDPDTLLSVREMETSALHPDIDAARTDQLTYIEDYRNSGGVLFPGRTEKHDLGTGRILQTVVVTARQINVPVDPDYFARPQ